MDIKLNFTQKGEGEPLILLHGNGEESGYFKNQIDLNDIQLQKFLHGEELELDYPNGMYVIKYHGVPLSGGKLKDKKLKNNYPKELRI